MGYTSQFIFIYIYIYIYRSTVQHRLTDRLRTGAYCTVVLVAGLGLSCDSLSCVDFVWGGLLRYLSHISQPLSA